MTARKWISEVAQAREADITGNANSKSNSERRDWVEGLVADNRRIHERDCLNLNPATNVMSPRAQAALEGGLGTRPSLGHPGDKYEVGLEAIESLEVITAAIACELFESEFCEARVMSGAMANLATFMATASPGDAIIAPPPAIGGHVTHHRQGAAGLYGLEIHEAPINAETYTVDTDAVAELADRVQPRLITIGASMNLSPHPVRELREIADSVGAILMFDAAHLCGMFAGGVWTNPLNEGAHVMTMSTYKSLGGPAGGLVLTNDEQIAKRIDTVVYPGLTANFDAGRLPALALTLLDWLDYGAPYAQEMVASAAALGQGLLGAGVELQTTPQGPTQSHQLAIRPAISATEAVNRLRQSNLLTCAIGLPDGTGVRVGTPEAVRWGMKAADMETLATFIAEGLQGQPHVAGAVTEWRKPFDTIHFCSD